MLIWEVVFFLSIWKAADSSTPITKRACEYQELNLSCEKGNVIRVIRANYGRLARDLCNDDGQVQWSGSNCTADSTYPIINDRCAQKQSCSIAADHRVFGDPCFGTLKYLEVEYVCEPQTANNTVHACENNVLNLRCESGRVIHVIRANYGRLVRDLCNDDGQVQWSGEDCMAYSSFSIVNDRCGQQRACNIEASSRVFGDQCPGTTKYLEVQHRCLPPRK